MASRPLLSVRNLKISVAGKETVHGLSLSIAPGELHVIMGPNGAGKSTLVSALMGHPAFSVKGTVRFSGKDLLKLSAHERALQGLFLGFQYPRELTGVSLRSFLFAAYNAQMTARDMKAKIISPIKFKEFLEAKAPLLHMDPAFLERSLNVGFSGGEKKKAEILQLLVLRPTLALLDETDSGLDIDALRVIAEGITALRKAKDEPVFTGLLVTHYARILEYCKPDFVHVMINGKIVESGRMALARKLEKEGYRKYGVEEK